MAKMILSEFCHPRTQCHSNFVSGGCNVDDDGGGCNDDDDDDDDDDVNGCDDDYDDDDDDDDANDGDGCDEEERCGRGFGADHLQEVLGV